MFTAIVEHIKYSYNDGKIRPAITVFRKRQKCKEDMRVWNPLIAHFAGYRANVNNDISKERINYPPQNTIGDQGNLEFTQVRPPILTLT